MSANDACLAQRWPALLERLARSAQGTAAQVEGFEMEHGLVLRVDGIQLTGAFDPTAEAELQAQLVPAGATACTLYGIGQGHLARELLRRPGLRRLEVVLLSERAARASLAHLDHGDWLADARVELRLPMEGEELHVPFAACPADLNLADGRGTRTRDLVRMELLGPRVARGLEARESEFAANLHDNRRRIAEDPDVGELFDSLPGGTLRLCAAGPTLDDHFGSLRRGQGTLIAVDAALKPLLAAGIVPDVVVSIDSLPHGMRAVFDVPGEALVHTSLVYFPVVPGDVLRDWPGRRLLALGSTERYRSLVALRPRAELWSSGSVIHPALDLALRMGATRVELYGADFANPRGKSHVDGSAWQVPVAEDRSKPTVLDGHGRPIPSQHNLIGYLRDVERFIARHPGVEFVNAGRDGARILGTSYAMESQHAH